MSAISTILTRLRAAIWAIDVRDDIANAIEQCYSDVSNPTLKTEALEAALQNKIDQGEMAALTIGDGTITAAKLASGVIDNTLATSGAAADAKKTGDEISAIRADLESLVRTSDIKEALLACFESVGWKDGASAESCIYNLEVALDGGEDEFYNVYERSIASGNIVISSGPATIDNATGDIWINTANATMLKRRKLITTTKGKKSYVDYTSRAPIGAYPVPVPKDATSCTVTANNSSYMIGADMYKFDKIANKYSIVSGGKAAAAGPMELTFSASPNKFLGIIFKRPNDADFATGEPSAVSIIFHREGE